jgi:hypothetical protein
VPIKPKIAEEHQLIDIQPGSINQILNDRLAAKVIDWAFKNRVDQGNVAEFHWDPEDKALLQKIFADPKAAGLDMPARDYKFRRFVQSIIQNGLNSTDATLFQRFKHRLPLRSVGLAHDLNDFSFVKDCGDSSLSSNSPLQDGFYMLEISVEPRQFSARIQIDTTATYQKAGPPDRYPLRAKSATVAKRLLWLKHDASVNIAISAPESAAVNKKDLTHFRLARLTRSFFLSRLHKKLGTEFDIKLAARINDDQLAALWQEYEYRFSASYTYSLSHGSEGKGTARTAAASPKEQLQEILRLLAEKR